MPPDFVPNLASVFPSLIERVDCYGRAKKPSDSRAVTSDSRNLRCPPTVRMHPRRPSIAHRVTVLGSTRNIAATSPGVSSLATPVTERGVVTGGLHSIAHGGLADVDGMTRPAWPGRSVADGGLS